MIRGTCPLAKDCSTMPTHLASLTFDFDAMSALIARGMKTPTAISRGEFGAVAVPRILAMLKKYGIKASFFVPGLTLETYPALVEDIVKGGHEIGHHGWTHVPPANLKEGEEEEHLVRGNELIQRLTGRKARGYRSPAWDLSGETVHLLLKHDFVYDSSMMGHDWMPYFARTGDVIHDERGMEFGTDSALIEMPISWCLDDYPHFEYLRTPQGLYPGLQNASNVLENWCDEFTYMTRNTDWGLLTYTFHPLVIGRGHRMLMMERLIQNLLEQGAEFVTLEGGAARWSMRR
jgi:peptidoglycan-N-acetylglucosamine deacetylase